MITLAFRSRALVLVALLLSPVIGAQQPAEPTYQGKPLSQWLKQMQAKESGTRKQAVEALGEMGSQLAFAGLMTAMNDENSEVRLAAISAMGKLGPDGQAAVPVLLDKLQDANADYRRAAARSLASIGLEAKALPPLLDALKREKDVMTRPEIIRALGKVGPPAKDAVPVLAGILRDPAVPPPRDAKGQPVAGFHPLMANRAAAEALADIGPAGVPALAEAVKDAKVSIKPQICAALARLGTVAKEASNALVEVERTNKNPEVRRAASMALEKVRGDPVAEGEPRCRGKALSRWLEQLGDADAGQRREAAEVLGILKTDNPKAIAALIKTARDSDLKVALAALGALAKVGSRAKDAVPVLVPALKDKDLAYRTAVLKVLAAIGPEAKAAVPVLLEILKDAEHSPYRSTVLITLVKLGPDKSALPLLLKLLESAPITARADLFRAVGAIGPDAQPAVPLLVKELRNTNNHSTKVAIEALVAIGPGALPAVEEVVKDSTRDTDVRLAALMVLGQSGPKALPMLQAAYKDKDPKVREQAVRNLGRLGPEAKPALPLLAGALRDRSTALAAAHALGAVGPVAVPTLLEALRDRDGKLRELRGVAIREEVSRALTKVAPEAQAFIPDFIELLKEDDSVTRLAGSRALVAAGPDALPALVEALKDIDNEQAHVVLGRFGSRAKGTVPALLKALRAEAPHQRQRAAHVLGMIGAAAGREAEQALKEAVTDSNPSVRREAANALKRFGSTP